MIPLDPTPDANGIFRQWVNCAVIRQDHSFYESACKMLNAYDLLWRDSINFYPVAKSETALKTGLLKAHGYEVRTGAANDKATRRWVMGRIFERELAPLHSTEYRDGWGQPGSLQRINRMIGALGFQLSQPGTYYARNAVPKRRWKEDLDWLKNCRDQLQSFDGSR